jgi:hypothetical protein
MISLASNGMTRPVRLLTVLLALAVPAAAHASTRDLCAGHQAPGDTCGPGHGRRTPGGNGKVSHLGWPAVTGIVWFANQNGSRDTGTELNDELLGGHGSDTISGGRGGDILWGDQLPTGNNGWQHDVLRGGPSPDWIYSSHGHNVIRGGSGNDRIWGHFGHGKIDCGPGHDTVHVKHHPTYRLRHCEVVLHH